MVDQFVVIFQKHVLFKKHMAKFYPNSDTGHTKRTPKHTWCGKRISSTKRTPIYRLPRSIVFTVPNVQVVYHRVDCKHKQKS